jgi:putative holliday junction resolvase
LIILGVDWGRARVGLAVSDETGFLARPLETIPAPSRASGVAGVAAAAQRWNAGEIVVGLPLHTDGSEGESAAKARAFADAVHGGTSLPVTLWDERFSSREGQDRTRESGSRTDKDAAAACVILQSYLDARRRRPE